MCTQLIAFGVIGMCALATGQAQTPDATRTGSVVVLRLHHFKQSWIGNGGLTCVYWESKSPGALRLEVDVPKGKVCEQTVQIRALSPPPS